MSQNAVIREAISAETILMWTKDNVLGTKGEDEPVFILMPPTIGMGDRIPPELLPEHYILKGKSILVRKEAIPPNVNVLDLMKKVRVQDISAELFFTRSYNISPWDLNSVLLVPFGELTNKEIYLL